MEGPIPDITNPHDLLFKDVFSRLEAARDLLRGVLPRKVWSLLQPKSLRLRKDSFVDASLREYFSDLLFEVDFKEGGKGFGRQEYLEGVLNSYI